MTLRRALTVVGSFAVSGIAIALVLRTADTGNGMAVIAHLDPWPLGLGVLVVLAQFALRSVRWHGLVEAIAGTAAARSAVAASLALGYLGNTVLPARLGEPIRAVDLSRRASLSLSSVAATVVLERLVDLLALGSIAAAAALLLATGGLLSLLLLPVALTGVVVLRIVGARLATLEPRGRHRAVAVAIRFGAHFSASSLPVILRAFVLSLLAWAGDSLLVWLCAASLGVPVTVPSAAVLGLGAAVATMIPSAGGYVGTYELGFVTAGSALALDPHGQLPLAVLVHVTAVLSTASLGVGVFLRRGLFAVRADAGPVEAAV